MGASPLCEKHAFPKGGGEIRIRRIVDCGGLVGGMELRIGEFGEMKLNSLG